MIKNKLIAVLIVFLILGTVPVVLGASNQNDQNASSQTAQKAMSQSSSQMVQREAISALAGQQKVSVASVSRRANNVDAFWIGTDGAIWTNNFNQNTWGRAMRITRAGAAESNGAVAVVARTPNTMNVFWVGTDGGIWTIPWTSGRWGTVEEITSADVAESGAVVTAVARTPNIVDIFWIGTDGLVWLSEGSMSSGQLNWGSESPISTVANVAQTNGLVAAVARTSNDVNIFWISNNGDIVTKAWSAGTGWGADTPIFGGSVADPAAGISAVARTSREVHVFFINNLLSISGAVVDLTMSGPSGSPLVGTSAILATAAGASQTDALAASNARSAQNMNIFWIDNTGGIWTRNWASATGSWVNQKQIAGRGATLTDTGVTVSNRSPLVMDLFWKGIDGRTVFTSSFRNNVWSRPIRISR